VEGGGEMKIDKILNNNVVIIKENDTEKIVMGRGIAFSKHAGDEIDPTHINKIFVLSTSDCFSKLEELLKDIPYEYVEFSESIISYAKTILGKRLDEKIYIDMTDHIYSAIQRFKKGIVIKNVLLWDIKRFYQDEYSIGKYTLNGIEEKFNLKLPEDEAGFIALHIVNAELSEGDIENVYTITKVMQEVMNIVKYTFRIEFNEESVYYYRFMMHLRFFAQRLINNRTYDDEDNELFESIKVKYKNSYKCTKKISDYVLKFYQYELTKEEQLYLTIHIERLVYKS
jgi:beta-glucoside operon transcriptional antiterminator